MIPRSQARFIGRLPPLGPCVPPPLSMPKAPPGPRVPGYPVGRFPGTRVLTYQRVQRVDYLWGRGGGEDRKNFGRASNGNIRKKVNSHGVHCSKEFININIMNNKRFPIQRVPNTSITNSNSKRIM